MRFLQLEPLKLPPPIDLGLLLAAWQAYGLNFKRSLHD